MFEQASTSPCALFTSVFFVYKFTCTQLLANLELGLHSDDSTCSVDGPEECAVITADVHALVNTCAYGFELFL